MTSKLLTALLFSAFLCPQLLPAAEPVVLEGSFNWTKQGEKTHPLKATFTSTGKDKWDVVFSFKWKNKPQNWKGTAEGDLNGGALKGTAETNGGKRTWEYSGKASDGVLKCNHTQLTRNGQENEVKTGTFELSAASAEEAQ